MRRVLDLAARNAASGRGGPFAALVVKGGEVVSEGTNLVTSTNDPTAHAEVVAIRSACQALDAWQLDGCVVYTSCEPCPMCLGALYWARPDRVFYAATRADAATAGFDDAHIYEELLVLPGKRRLPMLRILESEASRPFEAWRDNEERIRY